MALDRKDKLMVFHQEHHATLGDDILTQVDWDVLRLTADFLQPFGKLHTLAREKMSSSLDQLLCHIDILLKRFEDGKTRYADSQQLIHSIRTGWFVLDEYYAKTDKTPVYSAAGLLLHPSKKVKYLCQNWQENWHNAAMNKVRQIWARYKDLEFQFQQPRR